MTGFTGVLLEDNVVKQVPAEDTESLKVPEILQPFFPTVSGNCREVQNSLVSLCAKAAG
jgi:hypothetical protein